MGFFDKLNKKRSDDSADFAKTAASIFKTICGGEETSAKEIDSCTSSPREYAMENASQFAERGISADSADTNTLMWLGCVDILIKNAYAAELDFKCELEDLIFSLNELNSPASENITLDEDEHDPEADITVWLGEIDERLGERGLCVGGVDIDSDSYVVFLTDIQTLEKLKETANGIGYKIDRAKKL